MAKQAVPLHTQLPVHLTGLAPCSVLPATCLAGILALGLGVLLQLYVAGVNYSRNAPEGYNPVEDAKVGQMLQQSKLDQNDPEYYGHNARASSHPHLSTNRWWLTTTRQPVVRTVSSWGALLARQLRQ